MHFVCVFYPIAQKRDYSVPEGVPCRDAGQTGWKRDVPVKTERVATLDVSMMMIAKVVSTID